MLNDEMLCGGFFVLVLDRPGFLCNNWESGPLLYQTKNPQVNAEGPEFLPCPFTGGTDSLSSSG